MLAEELELGLTPLRMKKDKKVVVTRRVRVLEARCQEGVLPQRLRDAVEQYVLNGGELTRDVVEVLPTCGALTTEAVAADVTEGVDSGQDTDLFGNFEYHRVLEGGYVLQSKAFMLTFNSSAFSSGTWPRFKLHIEELHKKLGSKAWAANLEKSTHAVRGPAGTFHMHAYFYWNNGVGIYRRNTDEFVFEEVRPRVDVNTAKSPKFFYLAACHGLWYVTIKKHGTVENATNYVPWTHYVPKAGWLEGLWGAGKLTHAEFLQHSVRYGKGHGQRRRDALDAIRDEREQTVYDHVKKEMERLQEAKMWKPLRSFEKVDKFMSYFDATPRFRRPVLAIIGGTNLGKSMLASDVLERLGKMLELKSFLEVTVGGNFAMDLADFDLAKHAGVLFDGVADALFLKEHREVLQGRAKVCKGGQSATNVYAYPYTLCRRAVVVTFDLSATNLALLKTDHWLSDERNVVQLWLKEPAWRGAHSAVPTTVCPRDEISSWSVAALADFLCQNDMHGPATSLRTAGVNGADLLAFQSAAEMASDLRLPTFTARKLLQLRDNYIYKTRSL